MMMVIQCRSICRTLFGLKAVIPAEYWLDTKATRSPRLPLGKYAPRTKRFPPIPCLKSLLTQTYAGLSRGRPNAGLQSMPNG